RLARIAQLKLERFQQKRTHFCGSKARQNRDLDHFGVSGKRRNDLDHPGCEGHPGWLQKAAGHEAAAGLSTGTARSGTLWGAALGRISRRFQQLPMGPSISLTTSQLRLGCTPLAFICAI